MKRNKLILLAVFSIVLITRLFISFYVPNFTYDSYFHLRHIEEISSSGLPLYHDPLSYGGRTLIFLPAFHYLFAFFDLVFPLEIISKIISNLLIASLIFFVYLISKKITKREDAALLSAFVSGFIPIFWETNSISPLNLFLPLIALAVYSFMNFKKKKFVYLYLASIILLSFTTTATFLLIIGLIFYLLLSKIEKKQISGSELELSLFSLFFFLWVQFLFFKKVLLTEGISFIWQNIPPQIVSQYFPQISILHSIILVGIIPLLSGIYIIYRSLFEEKNKNIFLLFSLFFSTILLLIFRLVELKTALVFLGLLAAILFAPSYQALVQYLEKTRLTRFKNYSLALIILLIMITSAYPAVSFGLNQETPSYGDIKTFVWLREHTRKDSTGLATLEEGHMVTYFSERKNIMDNQFSLIDNIEDRFTDLRQLYTTGYQTEAVKLLNKYEIDYLFLTNKAKEKYQIDSFPYLDQECFDLVSDREAQIYESKCHIESVGRKK